MCFLVLSLSSLLRLSLFLLIILRCLLLGEAVVDYFFFTLKQTNKQRSHALDRTQLFLLRFIWQIVFLKINIVKSVKFPVRWLSISGHSLFVKLNQMNSCVYIQCRIEKYQMVEVLRKGSINPRRLKTKIACSNGFVTPQSLTKVNPQLLGHIA